MAALIDLNRARAALAELDRLAAAHPERCQRGGSSWADNKEELSRIMSTPAKQRIKDYRARLRERGYKATTIYINDETRALLMKASAQSGLSNSDVIALALAAAMADGVRPAWLESE